MKITILGSGSSSGVPMMGGNWGVCNPDNPKNQRLRASVLIEDQETRILIDMSPDLRQQCLRHDIKTVDAILLTHDHADHLHGIDEVRGLNVNGNAPLPLYVDARTLGNIQRRFNYIFDRPLTHPPFYKPALIPHVITYGQPQPVGNTTFTPFRQHHGEIDSMGVRIGKVAYSTDVKAFPPESEPFLHGLDLWIVDCLQRHPHPTHAHLETTLSWIEHFKPKRAILTHMNNDMDYEELSGVCPPHVEVGWDGVVIKM